MKVKEYNFMVFSCEEDKNIVYIDFLRSLRIDLSTAIEIVANRIEFTENKMHYIVADVSKVREVTSDAKKYLQREDTGLKNILGAALIASNPVAALIANIFIKAPKNFQARFFSSKKEAYNWVSKQAKTIMQVL